MKNRSFCHPSFQTFMPKFFSYVLFTLSLEQLSEMAYSFPTVTNEGGLLGRSDPRAIFVCGKAKFIHAVRWTFVTEAILNVTILTMSEISVYGIYVRLCIYIHIYIHTHTLYTQQFLLFLYWTVSHGACWRKQTFYIQLGFILLYIDSNCDVLQEIFQGSWFFTVYQK